MPRINPSKDFLGKEFVKKFCDDMLAYFDVEPYKEIKKESKQLDGGAGESYTVKLVANPLPTIQGFAKHIGYSSDKIRSWGEKYPEIKETMVRCRDIAENMLLNNSLMGLYQASSAIFAQKNMFGWTDRGSSPATLLGDNSSVGTLNINTLLIKIDDNYKDKGLLETK